MKSLIAANILLINCIVSNVFDCFQLISMKAIKLLSFKGGGDKDILREFLGGWEENIDFWYQKMY